MKPMQDLERWADSMRGPPNGQHRIDVVTRVRAEALDAAADLVEKADDGAPLTVIADAIRALKEAP